MVDSVTERIVLAPMVRGSELGFRSLIAEIYGSMICYSPMIRADVLVAFCQEQVQEGTTAITSTTVHEDVRLFLQDCSTNTKERLVVQLCGSLPSNLAKACRLVLDRNPNLCGIDLNLGCPQSCAREGNFGAFMHHATAVQCVRQMRLVIDPTRTLSVKIRFQDTLEATITFAKTLQAAGCDALAVHCRKRDEKFDGEANLEAARALVQALDIPVYVNGANVKSWEDAQTILKKTGAAKLMVARPLLADPYIFIAPSPDDPLMDPIRNSDLRTAMIASRYLVFAARHPPPSAEYFRLHFKWFFRRVLRPTSNPDFKNWRHRLWNFLQRPYLQCLEQFQLVVVLFCSTAEIPVPETLEHIAIPSFGYIRHLKNDKKGKIVMDR